MRLATSAFCATIGLLCAFAPAASADVKVVVDTQTYDISGTTGDALVAAMKRKGPRHGFMARAIAQTRYTKTWDFDFARTKGSCRIRQANGTLNLTFAYPRVVSVLPPSLDKRWKRFIAGVTAHEQTHGRIARAMMDATETSLTGLTFPDDAQCVKTRREANRRIKATYDAYEGKQNAFDAREHQEGGHVEYLVDALEQL